MRTSGVVACSSLLTPISALYNNGFASWLSGDPNEVVCNQKFKLAIENSLQDKPICDVMIAIGRSFLGVEYSAKTLEEPGDEHLVCNLTALDCVLLCENTLSLSRCIKMNKMSFADYKNELQRIRYRDGVIDKYPSRLHYFSDWIYNNEEKGIVKDITEEVGGVLYEKKINYMTAHRESYVQLASDEFLGKMKEFEEKINRRTMYHIPKERVNEFADRIHDGDIIGITTDLEGMDIAHTGLAIKLEDGALYFLHAPNIGHKVQITEKPLQDYLAKNKRQIGIMIARPLDPA
jgi:hypothetical protein